MGPVTIIVTTIEAVKTAVKVERQVVKIVDVLKAFGAVAALIPVVGSAVAEALEDGDVSVEEAVKIAVDAAGKVDAKIKIHGIDVLTPEAQAHIAEGLAMVAANAIAASKA